MRSSGACRHVTCCCLCSVVVFVSLSYLLGPRRDLRIKLFAMLPAAPTQHDNVTSASTQNDNATSFKELVAVPLADFTPHDDVTSAPTQHDNVTSFKLHGVSVQHGFSDPKECPWLRYNYICSPEHAYTKWLATWGAETSSLQPPLDPLPRGVSLWLGMSHSFESFAALMCQHQWELSRIDALFCSSPGTGNQCKTKMDAYSSRKCNADPEHLCKMVAVSPTSRCNFDSWRNVLGIGGTKSRAVNTLPTILQNTPEDMSCGVDKVMTPACDFGIVSFHFNNGHRAISIHNHALQFVDRSLERLSRLVGFDMKYVNTLVYASPWPLRTGLRKACACPNTSYTCLPAGRDKTFFVDYFRQNILGFARTAGFIGSIIFTTRFHAEPLESKTIIKFLKMSKSAGIGATFVSPNDVVRRTLKNQWCGDKPHNLCTSAGGHQCIPSVPDVVAWEIQRNMKAI